MLALVIEQAVTLGFLFLGTGDGGFGWGFFLFLPFLLVKFMFFALFFGYAMPRSGPWRGPRNRRPVRPRRSRRRPVDPQAEAEQREYREDLRRAQDEVDSWTTFDL